jgi:hypothetical protein
MHAAAAGDADAARKRDDVAATLTSSELAAANAAAAAFEPRPAATRRTKPRRRPRCNSQNHRPAGTRRSHVAPPMPARRENAHST